MMTLYKKGTAVGKLLETSSPYFSEQTKPTARHLFELVLSMLVLNGYQSTRFLYGHFVRKISKNSLNSYYYTLNESKIDLTDWMEKLISATLSIIPHQFSQYPIVLAIDDTMVEKFGNSFFSFTNEKNILYYDLRLKQFCFKLRNPSHNDRTLSFDTPKYTRFSFFSSKNEMYFSVSETAR